jgi:hypothetical protein
MFGILLSFSFFCLPELNALGWSMRNLLTALCYSFQNISGTKPVSSEIKVIAVRGLALRHAIARARRRSDTVLALCYYSTKYLLDVLTIYDRNSMNLKKTASLFQQVDRSFSA